MVLQKGNKKTHKYSQMVSGCVSLLGNPNNPKETKGHLLILGDSSYSFQWCKSSVNSNTFVSAPETNTQVRKMENCSNSESQSHQQIDIQKNRSILTYHPPNKICNNEKLHLSNDQLQRRSRLCCLCLMIRKLPQRIDFFGSAPVLPRHRLGNRYPGIHIKRLIPAIITG